MVIWESYAMEEFKKPDAKARVQISRDEKLFAAIVLADVATPEVKAARVAAEKYVLFHTSLAHDWRMYANGSFPPIEYSTSKTSPYRNTPHA